VAFTLEERDRLPVAAQLLLRTIDSIDAVHEHKSCGYSPPEHIFLFEQMSVSKVDRDGPQRRAR